jgi:hypothetical protein
MQRSNRPSLIATKWTAILVTAGLAISVIVAVQILTGDSTSSDPAPLPQSEPAIVEHIEDSDLSRIILTERAAERLRIRTEPVRTEQVNGAATMVVPFSAVYYDPNGEAWVYTNPEPLTYVRHAIKIDRTQNGETFFTEGPPAETAVVTVGVAELYGTEFGIGH